MACKWIYKGKVYTENQFIAVMANEMLQPVSTGKRIETWGRELETKVDEFFRQNPAMSSIIPPQIVKLALKSAAKLLIAGGKITQAVEHAIKYIQNNITDTLTNIEKQAIKDAMKQPLLDGKDKFYEVLSQTQSNTEAEQAMYDEMFEGLEQLIDEAKEIVEVKSIIEEFVKTNKNKIAGLNRNRIVRLFVAASLADYKGKAKQFLRTANKLLQKQELHDTIDNVIKNQKEVAKNLGKFTNIKNDIEQFLDVDADDLATIDEQLLKEYDLALSDLMNRGVKDIEKAMDLLPRLATFHNKQKGRRVTGMSAVVAGLNNVSDIRNFLSNLQAQGIADLEELKVFNRTLSMLTTRAAELLADANTQNDVTAYNQMLDFIQNELPNVLGQNAASQAFKAEIEQLKKDTINKAFQIKKPNKSFGIRDASVNEFFSWTKEELESLTPAETLTYAGVREAVELGYIPPQLYTLNNKITTLKDSKTIIRETAEVAQAYQGLSKFQKLAVDALSSMPGTPLEVKDKLTVRGKQHWDAMFGTEGKKTFWKTVLNPLHKSFLEVTKQSAKEMTGFENSLKNLKGFYNRHLSQKNTEDYNITMSKLGIILAQLDFQSNFVGWDDLPADQKDLYKRVSDSPKKIANVSKDKLNIDKKAYAELEKLGAVVNGVLDPAVAKSKLSSNERLILDQFQKVIDTSKEKARIMTEKRGEPFNEQKNYWPRQVISSFSDTEEANSALAAANVKTGNAIGTRASATKQRVENAVNYYNFNIEQVAKKHVRQINQDFYLTDNIKRSMGTLNKVADELEESNQKQQAVEIRGILQAIEDGLRSELSSQYLLGQGDTKYINSILKGARNLTLSNPTRIATELMSNMIRNWSLLPDARDYAWEPILDELGASVYLKGNKYMFEAREASQTTLAKANDFAMQLSDSLASRQMWINEFKKSFKQSTGTEFNQNLYLDPAYKSQYESQIKDAAEIAEMQVNKYYNSQSGFIAPSRVQITPFSDTISREAVIAKIFGYMNSFAANEALLAKMSLKHFAEGNYNKGATQLGRLLISNYTFTLMSAVAGSALKAFFDDEDDDFLEFIEKTFAPFNAENWDTTLSNGAYATIGSLALGRFSNLFRVTSGVGMGILMGVTEKDNELVKEVNKVLKDVFFIKPVLPIAQKQDPKNQFDYVIENVAPGLGMGLSDILEGIMGTAGVVSAGISEEKELKTSDLLLMSKGGLYALSLMSGGIPFGALAKRSLNTKVAESIKAESEEAKYQKYYEAAIAKKLKPKDAEKYATTRIERAKYRKELEQDESLTSEEIQKELDKKYPLN